MSDVGGDPRGPLRRAEDPRPMSREELPAGSGGQVSASPGGDCWAGEEPPAAERAAPQLASSPKGPAGSGLKPRPRSPGHAGGWLAERADGTGRWPHTQGKHRPVSLMGASHGHFGSVNRYKYRSMYVLQPQAQEGHLKHHQVTNV